MDSPFQSRAGKVSEASLPPPLYVHYLPEGEIREAWRSAQMPYSGFRRPRGAKKAGMIFQRRVATEALAWSCGAVEVEPWFCFVDGSGERHYCQPDLLLYDKGRIIVVETKLRWTSDAWWQLRKLYLPVLAKVFPQQCLLALCVCRSYDPHIVIPEDVVLRNAVTECSEAFNVMVVR